MLVQLLRYDPGLTHRGGLVATQGNSEDVYLHMHMHMHLTPHV